MIARRNGVLFLGFAVLASAHREEPEPGVRRRFLLVIGVTMAAMAVLGLVEILRGTIGPGIWLAIAVEMAIAGLAASLTRAA